MVAITYTPRGGALELFKSRAPECLIEGPAGTGKTRAILELVYRRCLQFPGIRVLLARQTRKSMTESVLVTWEEKVLFPGHPCITGSATRANRSSYTFPFRRNEVAGKQYAGESHIVIAGLDNPGRTYSTEFDIVVVFESWEVPLDSWERLQRCLRNDRMPWQQAIADTNPAQKNHWLNKRAGTDVMQRILSRHVDNPSLKPAYLRKLASLTGVRRDRLYLGLWVSAEGLVYPMWDPAVHMVSAHELPTMDYYVAGVDWGFTAPGVMQVWGVHGQGKDKELYRVAEVYQTKKQLDWWADVACEFHEEFDLKAIYCDPAEPRSISYFNQRIGSMTGRDMVAIARGADNRKTSKKKGELIGHDLVRWGLSPNEHTMRPRTFLVHDALRKGRDPDLVEDNRPWNLEEEIQGFSFKPVKDEGDKLSDEVDPKAPDHALDPMRYVHNGEWGGDHNAPEDEDDDAPMFPGGSYGDLLGHERVLGDAA